MGTLGWVFITGAFLVLIMVMNNSWPWVVSKVTGQPVDTGSGKTIQPSPGDTNPAPTIPGTDIPIPGIGAPSGPNPPMTQIPNPNDPNGPPLNVYG